VLNQVLALARYRNPLRPHITIAAADFLALLVHNALFSKQMLSKVLMEAVLGQQAYHYIDEIEDSMAAFFHALHAKAVIEESVIEMIQTQEHLQGLKHHLAEYESTS
jgi:hypothetical protein